jgi:hypothetical protein
MPHNRSTGKQGTSPETIRATIRPAAAFEAIAHHTCAPPCGPDGARRTLASERADPRPARRKVDLMPSRCWGAEAARRRLVRGDHAPWGWGLAMHTTPSSLGTVTARTSGNIAVIASAGLALLAIGWVLIGHLPDSPLWMATTRVLPRRGRPQCRRDRRPTRQHKGRHRASLHQAQVPQPEGRRSPRSGQTDQEDR